MSASPPEFGLDLTRLDQTLAEVEGLLADAHFPTAVGVATQGVRSLNEMEPSPAVRARRARLEVLVATAEVALGQQARARASLQRALAAEPQLALDPATTSPKVIAALRAARRAPAPPPPVRSSP